LVPRRNEQRASEITKNHGRFFAHSAKKLTMPV
jgi:hypothetical protein